MARLAYLGPDGTPRVIPIGFYWTGDQVVVSTAVTAPKVAALRARPDVALTIEAGETPDRARSVSIRGRASVEIVDGVPGRAVRGVVGAAQAMAPSPDVEQLWLRFSGGE